MDSIDVEFYRLAGYSVKSGYDNILSTNKINFRANEETAISNSYSCIFNWATMRYTFIGDSVKTILGYDKQLFLERGFNFVLSIIHPADLEKLKDIYITIFKYYYNHCAEQRPQLRFSYNFRIKTINGSYIHILRQSTFSSFTNNGKPTLEYINSTDITGFRNNNNITLTVHQISQGGTYILRYEHEFSKSHQSLSEREKQVLNLVQQGFTTRQIACKLYLSIETIKSHRKHIISKMDVGNMTAAISKVNNSTIIEI